MNGSTSSTASQDAGDDVSILMASFATDLDDPAMAVALIADFSVRDGTQQRIASAFADAMQRMAGDPGMLTYEVHRERHAPTRFVVYERWRSLADLDAHLRTPYVRTLRRLIDEVLVGDPAFRVLIPVRQRAR